MSTSTAHLINVSKPQRSRTDPPSVAVPMKQEDRDYLQMMYQEHAEQARQHENLRATATSLFVALIVGILAFAATGTETDINNTKSWISGGAICLLSLLGAILNQKHYERNRLHTDVLFGIRSSLESDVSAGIGDITTNFRNWHAREWPFLDRKISSHGLWNIVYSVTGVIGMFMIMRRSFE